jgi:predicted RNA-binding Zn-ribbon protein involved in translation (DUF1610 family)
VTVNEEELASFAVETFKREANVMVADETHEVRFQCPNCGHDLKQTIGRLRASEHMTCPGCGVGINIDANRLADATEEIRKAIGKSPPEITIKFFR